MNWQLVDGAYELTDAEGLVLAVVELHESGWWNWDGPGLFDFGTEPTKTQAMDRAEEIINPTVH